MSTLGDIIQWALSLTWLEFLLLVCALWVWCDVCWKLVKFLTRRRECADLPFAPSFDHSLPRSSSGSLRMTQEEWNNLPRFLDLVDQRRHGK